MKKQFFHLVTMLILAAIVLNACGAKAPEMVEAKFAYDYWAGYYPGLIAIQKGYYAESGLDLKAIKPENTDSMMADFLAGKYDFIAVAFADVIPLLQFNDDVYFIFASDESAGGDAFLASPEITSIADLKGKVVGVNRGGFAEIFITTVFEENNLNPGDVEFVNMDASELPGKLRDKSVEAGHTWEPYVTESKNDGNKVLFTTADTPGLILDGIAVRGQFAREHPEAIKAFVQGWFKAVDFWLANFEEGNKLAAQITGDDPANISLEGIGLKTLADNQALYQKGESTASIYFTANLYVDFYVRTNALTSKPSIDKLLNPEFLKP